MALRATVVATVCDECGQRCVLNSHDPPSFCPQCARGQPPVRTPWPTGRTLAELVRRRPQSQIAADLRRLADELDGR